MPAKAGGALRAHLPELPWGNSGGPPVGTSIQTLLALFYANGGLVASPESARLQGVFDALTGLFGQVVLLMN